MPEKRRVVRKKIEDSPTQNNSGQSQEVAKMTSREVAVASNPERRYTIKDSSANQLAAQGYQSDMLSRQLAAFSMNPILPRPAQVFSSVAISGYDPLLKIPQFNALSSITPLYNHADEAGFQQMRNFHQHKRDKATALENQAHAAIRDQIQLSNRYHSEDAMQKLADARRQYDAHQTAITADQLNTISALGHFDATSRWEREMQRLEGEKRRNQNEYDHAKTLAISERLEQKRRKDDSQERMDSVLNYGVQRRKTARDMDFQLGKEEYDFFSIEDERKLRDLVKDKTRIAAGQDLKVLADGAKRSDRFDEAEWFRRDAQQAGSGTTLNTQLSPATQKALEIFREEQRKKKAAKRAKKKAEQ